MLALAFLTAAYETFESLSPNWPAQLLMTRMSYVSLRIRNSVNAVQAERLMRPVLGTEMAGRPLDASPQSILFYSAWRFYALAAGPQQGKYSFSHIKSFSTQQGQR